MRILILPPSDYLGHPNPCRIHHIFEKFPDFGDSIYVMRFSLHDKTVRKSNAKVFSIGDVRFKSPSIYYLLNSGVFAKSAMNIINKFDIDIILFSNLYPPYLISKLIPRELMSIVDLVDHYPTVATESIPAFIPKQLANALFSGIMKSVISKCDFTIACSHQLVDYARRSGAKNVYRIPNGVEDYFFLDFEKEATEIRRKLGIKDSDILMCFVGNIEYWLDMEELIRALYQAKKNVKKKIKFLIVGGKLTTNYFFSIQRQIKSLNLGENVVETGFVPHKEVPKYIAASDICVSPKNIRDPVSYYSSPVKVWEYLAQGKPVISTPIPEVLSSAKECVSIANTSTEYLSIIMAFSEDPDYFLEKAEKGKALAREYTWTKIAKAYRNLLSSLSDQN